MLVTNLLRVSRRINIKHTSSLLQHPFQILSQSFSTKKEETEGLKSEVSLLNEKLENVKENEDIVIDEEEEEEEIITNIDTTGKKTVTMRKKGMLGRYKKYMFLLRMISGLSTREAIAQLQFHKQTRAKYLNLLLNRAARTFTAKFYPLNGYETTLKIARADRGSHRTILDVKTPKVRGGMIKRWKSNITLVIEEGLPKISEKKERKIQRIQQERKEAGLPEITPEKPWEPASKRGYRENRVKKWKLGWALKASEGTDA